MSTQTPDLRTAAQAVIDRWYMVARDGMAMLCADREDAEAEARKADRAYPRNGTHRAVQLVEAQAGARPTPAHIEAMERAWLWMENQADSQSKGGHATFDLMMLREERDALRAAIDAAPTTQPACQQEAQEPVAGHCRFPGGAWAECSPEHVRMVRANPEEWKGYEVRYLYAEPQPSPAAQGDALDAERYRWLRERSSTMFVNISINGEGAEIAATLDSAVDAARAAQEGK